VGLYFLQITDRYVDGSAQVNCAICVSFSSPVAQPDDFSTQRSTLRISGRMPAARLINR
jgi:hypothetical protein